MSDSRLADFCASIDYGYTTSASNEVIGPRFLRITDIVGGPPQWEQVPYCEADEKTAAKFKLNDADVVVARTGATTGVSAYIQSPPAAVFASYLVRLVADTSVADARFISYYLKGPQFWGYMRGVLGDKSAQPNASAKTITQAPATFPKPDEQRAIASVLGALDDKIEQNRRTTQALEKLARAIFRAWFVDFEPVKAKAAGATSFPSMPQPVFDALPTRLVDSAIGPVPEGWEVKSLRDVCDVNAKSLRAGEVEGEIEYVNISSVTRGHLDQIERLDFADAPSRARRVIQDGDTIWSCVRPNRMSYLYIHNPPENRIVSTGFAVLTPTAVGPSFLYQLTTQPEFVDYLVANATGSAYPAVRADHFEAAQFGCAPKSALDAFESATSCMRRWIGEAENESRKLAQMRDYLLPKLLSGQIRVRAAERAAATVA
ncbi:MAG TPA: restriction endonuclease subunit S [Rhodanobacteraceae bacterium]|nr:restriction endonuclease subunit S [Rhodanobacteraceae bacterium]